MHGELSESGKQAWVALLLAHSAAHRAIDSAMRVEGLPSLEVYDVLLNLENAPDRRLRMAELAEAVIYSPSGLTRLIDRMERAGWVRRQACPGDRRAVHVSLTPEGLAQRERAWPRYAELIQEHFGRFLSDEAAHEIASGLMKIGDSARPRRCPGSGR